MPIHDPPSIYLNLAGSVGELLSAVRCATLGVTALRPATFRVEEGGEVPFAEAFRSWVGGDFRDLHGPHFKAVVEACREGGAREVAELDRRYQARILGLGAGWVDSSIDLGEHVLDALPGVRHARLVDRVRGAVEEGRMPGHFATALACHTVVFNVSLAHGLMTQCYLEWWFAGGGGRETGIGDDSTRHREFVRDAEFAGVGDRVADLIPGRPGEQTPLIACA